MGGQCKIISDVFMPGSYTIIDLDVVLPLVRKYLTKLKVENVIYLAPQQIDVDKEYDLVISNYAFSECIKSVQDDFIDKILYRSRRGYLTCNRGYRPSNHSNDKPASSTLPYNKEELCQILSRRLAIDIMDERPKTAPYNFIIKWNNAKNDLSNYTNI